MQLLATTATNGPDIVVRVTDQLPTVACEYSQITSCCASLEDDALANDVVKVIARARGGAPVGSWTCSGMMIPLRRPRRSRPSGARSDANSNAATWLART